MESASAGPLRYPQPVPDLRIRQPLFKPQDQDLPVFFGQLLGKGQFQRHLRIIHGQGFDYGLQRHLRMAFGTAPLIEDQVFQGSHQPSLRFRMHHQLFFSEKRQQKGVLDQVLCLLYAASHAVRQFKHFFILLRFLYKGIIINHYKNRANLH